MHARHQKCGVALIGASNRLRLRHGVVAAPAEAAGAEKWLALRYVKKINQPLIVVGAIKCNAACRR